MGHNGPLTIFYRYFEGKERVALDSYLRNVEQNECKKSYRAKNAKLAKASPTPSFFTKLYLGVLGVLCARYNLFLSSRRRKNSNRFGLIVNSRWPIDNTKCFSGLLAAGLGPNPDSMGTPGRRSVPTPVRMVYCPLKRRPQQDLRFRPKIQRPK